MTSVINNYKRWLKQYSYLPLANSVIFIVDNDNGGENVLKAANKYSQQDIQTTSNDAFFHIQRNLYLVKTPPANGGNWSAMEDCFPEEVLRQTIGGKRLDLKKKHEDETNFGKQIFAEKIVRPSIDRIDFPVLCRFSTEFRRRSPIFILNAMKQKSNRPPNPHKPFSSTHNTEIITKYW